MPLIDRYFLQEIGKTLLAILIVLLLIFFGSTFIRLLKEVSLGSLNASLLFQMVGLEILRQLGGLAAPAFLFAVLFAVGRMYRDSEIAAMESCGLSDSRLLRSIFITLLPITLVVAWLSLEVSPWSARVIENLLNEQQGQAGALAGISAGRFNEYSGGDLVFYVESMERDERRMKNLFVHHRRENQYDLISAAEGYQEYDKQSGGRYFILKNGYRYQGTPGALDYQISKFDLYAIRLTDEGPIQVKKPWKGFSNEVLLSSDDVLYQTEFQLRLSTILSLFTVALLAFPLCRSAPRKSPYGRLVAAMIFYVFYFSLQGTSKKWMSDGVTPVWLGLWWVHLSVAILTLPLYLTNTRHYRRWRRIFLRSIS